MLICVYPVVARQWLGRHIPAATNTSKNRRSVGDVVFYAVRVYQTGVCGSVYSLIVARQRLGKHVPTVMKNYWSHNFLCGPCRNK
jgi:hypothetical protein